MFGEITTFAPFFEDPYRVFSAREVARAIGKNHITVSKRLCQASFIQRVKNGPYTGFKALINSQFTRLRWFYNLDRLCTCGIIEEMRSFYDEGTIVLFGSYATATNTRKSDIDIAVIATHTRQMDTTSFEASLGHPIQLFLYTREDIDAMKSDNPELLNSICNGIVLNGELEVFI